MERSFFDKELQRELKSCWARQADAHSHARVREPPWVCITRDSWHEALNVLPPRDWRHGGFVESFMLAELWSADEAHVPIGWLFARHRGRYFVTLARVTEQQEALARLPAEVFA